MEKTVKVFGIILFLVAVVITYSVIDSFQKNMYISSFVECERSDNCNVKLGERFILLDSYNGGMIIGGCYLHDINFDSEYLEETDPITHRRPQDYIFGSYRTYHLFTPKKIGQTVVVTTGTCSYSGTYNLTIS